MSLFKSAPDGGRILLGFLALNALAGLSVGTAKVTLSLFAVELEADAFLMGLIAGAQSIGILLLSLPVGVLVDQYSPLRLFTIGTVITGVLYLLMPLVDNAVLLCVVVAVISGFMPLRIVSLNTVFMQQISRVGVGMAGWFRGTHMIGFLLLGPMLAALLANSLGFAGSYLVIAAIFFLLLLLAPRVMRHYQPSAAHVRQLSLAELRAQIGLLKTDSRLLGTSVSEFCVQAANQYYAFFIIVIAIQGFRFSAADAAGLISAQGASFVLTLLTMGKPAWRMGQQRFRRLGCIVVITALVLLGLASVVPLLWLGAILLGLGLGMLQIVNISGFAEAGSRLGQGRVAGLNTFFAPAGGLTGSMAGGFIGHYFGLQTTFLFLVPVFLLFLLRLRTVNVATTGTTTSVKVEEELPGETVTKTGYGI